MLGAHFCEATTQMRRIFQKVSAETHTEFIIHNYFIASTSAWVRPVISQVLLFHYKKRRIQA